MPLSPNVSVRPITAAVNKLGHLEIGGVDTVRLAEQFGTPLWVLDEDTIRAAAYAYRQGLESYPKSVVLYAGKSLLCLAMCRLAEELGLGLDVVSEGELHTATCAGFPSSQIFMHGNNKRENEIETGIIRGATIITDNLSELEMTARIADALGKTARLLLRLTPGVEPDTHDHIKTGHHDSKFGIPMEQLDAAISIARTSKRIHLAGIHSHIGSQAAELEPYIESIEILAATAARLKSQNDLVVEDLNVGGGLAIAYTGNDRPVPIYDWAKNIRQATANAFNKNGLTLPRLIIEPGRTITGTAGVTLYRAGHKKALPSGVTYLAVDGGMADNPRPITYQAAYSAALANRMNAPHEGVSVTLAGKYCESGDIIIKDAPLPAETGDLIAVFGTGAYNLSMASNYNRSPRPACVLVRQGAAEVIVERESFDDLVRLDRIPKRLERQE